MRRIASRTGYLLMALVIGLLSPLAVWAAVGSGTYQVIRRGRVQKVSFASCSVDADCPPGYVCMGGRCVPASS